MKKCYTILMAALCLAAVGCKQATPEKQTDMKYRPLGNTGIEVSEISIVYGGARSMGAPTLCRLLPH